MTEWAYGGNDLANIYESGARSETGFEKEP
jgi:hypothetical protein